MKKYVLSTIFPSGETLYYFQYQGSFAFCKTIQNAKHFNSRLEAEQFLEQIKQNNRHIFALEKMRVVEESNLN